MQIIPVIDLLAGQVVRGIAGRRHEYRPIQSSLAPDPAPRAVARAYVEQLGVDQVYVADLDAIGGVEPAWDSYAQIADSGLRLWVDAGVATADRARRLAEFQHQGTPLDQVIVGLETLPSLAALKSIYKAVGPGRTTFSLDLKEGRPLTSAGPLRTMTPAQLAGSVLKIGIRRLIVLDLSRVGVGRGTGTEQLCQQLHQAWPKAQIISGGGVRNLDDLQALSKTGVSGALIASALHDGRLTRADIATVRRTIARQTRPIGPYSSNKKAKRASVGGFGRF